MSDTPEIARKPRKSRQANRLEWEQRLSRFDPSGLTVLDFCRAEGVAPQSSCLWKRRFAACAEPRVPVPEFLRNSTVSAPENTWKSMVDA